MSAATAEVTPGLAAFLAEVQARREEAWAEQQAAHAEADRQRNQQIREMYNRTLTALPEVLHPYCRLDEDTEGCVISLPEHAEVHAWTATSFGSRVELRFSVASGATSSQLTYSDLDGVINRAHYEWERAIDRASEAAARAAEAVQPEGGAGPMFSPRQASLMELERFATLAPTTESVSDGMLIALALVHLCKYGLGREDGEL